MTYDTNNKRNARTLKVLQQAMLTLMSDQSYETIKAVDICRVAMVHRTTFYLHFEDKEHLLNECVHQVKSQLEAEIVMSELTQTPSGYYAELLRLLVKYLDAHPNLQAGLVLLPENQIFWLKFQALIAHDVKQRMQHFAQNGYNYHVHLDINSQFFTNGIIGTLLWWLRHSRPIEASLFYEQITSLMDPRNVLSR